MWLMYGNFVTSTDFGRKKAGDQFLTPDVIYPDLKESSMLWDKNNYFAIGYDSYQKSNNYASVKLNLTPQVLNLRILDAQTYKTQDFVGFLAPRYFDIDYVAQNMLAYKENFLKYLQCEEWTVFTPDVLREFGKLNESNKHVFRSEVVNQFNTYHTNMLFEVNSKLEQNFNLFKEFYKRILGVNCVCNGVDGGTSKVGVRYLEVVPNVNATGVTTDLTIFNTDTPYPRDPLNAFPYPIDFAFSGDLSTYAEMYALPDDNKRGFFNHLAYQITNATMQANHLPVYDFGESRWEVDGAPLSTPIKLNTIFEKINHELLYFANLTSQMCINDVFAPEAKLIATQDNTKDITGYDNDHKFWVRTMLDLASTDNSYLYKEFEYCGSDSVLSNKSTSLQGIPIEHILFFNFIFTFVEESNLIGITDKLLTNSGDDTAQKSLVMNFIKALKNSKTRSALLGLSISILNYIERYDALITKTETDTEDMKNILLKAIDADPSGYTMKMFETESSRVRSYGRFALDNYYRFIDKTQ
jgi:hypothetical protein